MGKEVKDLDRDWLFAWWWPSVMLFLYVAVSIVFNWTLGEYFVVGGLVFGCLLFGKLQGSEMAMRFENHVLHADYQVRGCVKCLEENKETD